MEGVKGPGKIVNLPRKQPPKIGNGLERRRKGGSQFQGRMGLTCTSWKKQTSHVHGTGVEEEKRWN